MPTRAKRNAMPRSLCALGLLAAATLPASAPPAQAGAPLGCFGLSPTIVGSGEIAGTSGDDVIVGSPGDDRIDGNGGDDVVCALAGDDEIRLGGGTFQVDAGEGDDRIRVRGSDGVLVYGGPGADRIQAAQATEVVEVHAGDGDDAVVASVEMGRTYLYGDAGADRISAKATAGLSNSVHGGDGDDRLSSRGKQAGNQVHGELGDDVCKIVGPVVVVGDGCESF